MKTLYLRFAALGSLAVTLICIFSFAPVSSGGNGGGEGGQGGNCPPGSYWDEQLQECVPQKWVLKPCYSLFGESSAEDNFYATCQENTEEGILMECGAVTSRSPLPIARELQCIQPYEGPQ